MKGRVVLLDQIDGREAAALLVDGILEEIAIDPVSVDLAPGAVIRVEGASNEVSWSMPGKPSIRRPTHRTSRSPSTAKAASASPG